MGETERAGIEGAFDLTLPGGWAAERDEDGGLLMSSPAATGLLHLEAFEQEAGEMPDPAEELYAFLAEQGIELEEDDVEDFDLEGGAALALCEYLAEGEDEEERATYWLVAVATNPGNLVFANYSCPAGKQDQEREAVRDVLSTLRLTERS